MSLRVSRLIVAPKVLKSFEGANCFTVLQVATVVAKKRLKLSLVPIKQYDSRHHVNLNEKNLRTVPVLLLEPYPL